MNTESTPLTDKETEKANLSKLRIGHDMRKRPTSRFGWVIALILMLAAIFFSRSVWAPLLEGWRAPEVQVYRMRAGSSGAAMNAGDFVANGYVVAQRQAALAPKITGRLEKLYVVEGSVVEEGEVVADLEHRDLDAQRARAVAEQRQAQADLTRELNERAQAVVQLSEGGILAEASISSRDEIEALHMEAELELMRQETLWSSEMVSESVVERARANAKALEARKAGADLRVRSSDVAVEALEAAIHIADARIEGAKARLESQAASLSLLDVQLNYHTIRAPFPGVVIRKDAEVGEIVAPISGGAQARVAVVTLVDMNSLMIEADVNEAFISRVKPGQSCRISLDAFPDLSYRGSVFKIVPSANRQKATVEVKVEFENLKEHDNATVLPEMGARATFLSEAESNNNALTTESKLWVPSAAIVEDGKQTFVWVVVDQKTSRRSVSLGERSESKVEVLSGIEAGDDVILTPEDDLSENQRIKVESK